MKIPEFTLKGERNKGPIVEVVTENRFDIEWIEHIKEENRKHSVGFPGWLR